MNWTVETDKIGKELWLQGSKAREIAAQLGCTKSAVIGRAHRMRWGPSPLQKIGRPGKRLKKWKPNRGLNTKGPKGGVDIHDLRSSMCKWPLWDERSSSGRYCGADTVNMLVPYCVAHCRLAYTG